MEPGTESGFNPVDLNESDEVTIQRLEEMANGTRGILADKDRQAINFALACGPFTRRPPPASPAPQGLDPKAMIKKIDRLVTHARLMDSFQDDAESYRALWKEITADLNNLAPAPAPGADTREAEARTEIMSYALHLVGTIYFYGGFKAETYNERELARYLRELGYLYQSEDAILQALKDRSWYKAAPLAPDPLPARAERETLGNCSPARLASLHRACLDLDDGPGGANGPIPSQIEPGEKDQDGKEGD